MRHPIRPVLGLVDIKLRYEIDISHEDDHEDQIEHEHEINNCERLQYRVRFIKKTQVDNKLYELFYGLVGKNQKRGSEQHIRRSQYPAACKDSALEHGLNSAQKTPARCCFCSRQVRHPNIVLNN